MAEDLIIINANLDRTNVVEFKDFYLIYISTLMDIMRAIRPICGENALLNLVIYRNTADKYGSNIFSNDGIHILQSTEYMSPIQTFIANHVRYIAERVERAASDGTSTAIYLAASIIASAFNYLGEKRYAIEKADGDDGILCDREIMKVTHDLIRVITNTLNAIKLELKELVIDMDEVSPEFRSALIYQLAHTTSKGNAVLTEYALELFSGLPKLLYEQISFDRSAVETEEDFIIDRPEHDLAIAVSLSHNTKYNSKLNTEVLFPECDLLICPSLYGKTDELLECLNDRKSATHLVILFSGVDDNEQAKLDRYAARDNTTLCRQLAFLPTFISNPLELNVAQVMGGQPPMTQKTAADFANSIITGVSCRAYNQVLFISNLFDSSTAPLHPSFVSGKDEHYNKLRADLGEQIEALSNKHIQSATSNRDLKEFVRIYRNLICSKLAILTVGGLTTNHLANVNVVEDVMGVTSVAMKHGVILDLMPKLANIVGDMTGSTGANCLYDIHSDIVDFCRLTYPSDDVCTKLEDSIGSKSKFKGYVDGFWLAIDATQKSRINVVQSYKAIAETIDRLIETIPKIIGTDRIIVQNSVMNNED